MSVGYDFCPNIDGDGELSASFSLDYDRSTEDTVHGALPNRYGPVANALSVVAMFGEEAQLTVGEAITEEVPQSDEALQTIREQVATTYARDATPELTSAKDVLFARDNEPGVLNPPTHHAQYQRSRRWLKRLLPSAEHKEAAPKFAVRPSTIDDIADIARVDVEAFGKVYRGEGYEDKTPEELYAEKYELFKGRFEKVGGNLMPVLLRDGKVVGVVTSCPTNKEPKDFTSWEQTTDNGDLGTTYSPDGKNLYVVSLSVLPEGTAVKDMLVLHQMGEFLKGNYDKAFFESRVPQFRNWVNRQAEQPAESYPQEELDDLAQQYFELRIDRAGKKSVPFAPLLRVFGVQTEKTITRSVPFDPLLRFYERIGCQLAKILPDAYQDEASMNYGVLCVYDGKGLFDGTDLPVPIPQNKFTRQALGCVLQLVGKSPKLTGKIF